MNRIIQVKVSGDYLTKDTDQAGTQHEANATRLRITFDESWDSYAKSVTFWDARGLNPVTRVLTVDLLEDITKDTRIYLCPIPGEPMAIAGKFQFVIEGYVGAQRQRAVGDVLRARPAPRVADIVPSVDPTPTQAQQIQGQIEAVIGDIQRAVNAANAADAALATAQAAQDAAGAATAAAAEATQAAENAKNAVISKHADRHGAGGDDAITPDMIGAATAEAVQAAQNTANAAQNAANTAKNTADGKVSKTGDTIAGKLRVSWLEVTDYSQPIEAPQWIDFHLIGSTSDYDGRLYIDGSGDIFFNYARLMQERHFTKSTTDIGEGVAMAPGSFYIVYE